MKKFSNKISKRLTARHKKCFKFVGSVKDKRILDIGCSFGWFEAWALKNKCKEMVGIEPKRELLVEAKNQVPEGKYRVGSALKIPFKDNSFDIVVVFDVLEHLPKGTEISALKEIERVLKSKGKLYLSTPLSNILSNLLDLAWYFGHRHYSGKQIKRILSMTNLKIKKYEYRGGVISIFSMILFYPFKWLVKREIPFKDWFERKKSEEYLKNKKGFSWQIICAVKD